MTELDSAARNGIACARHRVVPLFLLFPPPLYSLTSAVRRHESFQIPRPVGVVIDGQLGQWSGSTKRFNENRRDATDRFRESRPLHFTVRTMNVLQWTELACSGSSERYIHIYIYDANVPADHCDWPITYTYKFIRRAERSNLLKFWPFEMCVSESINGRSFACRWPNRLFLFSILIIHIGCLSLEPIQ